MDISDSYSSREQYRQEDIIAEMALFKKNEAVGSSICTLYVMTVDTIMCQGKHLY